MNCDIIFSEDLELRDRCIGVPCTHTCTLKHTHSEREREREREREKGEPIDQNL